MSMLHFFDLATITQGKVLQMADRERPVRYLVTDSRKALGSSDVLFIAIQGQRHDGHQYINQLYQNGISQFLVTCPPENWEGLKHSNILRVADTKVALQQIAAFHRQQFHIPVIGITGSNGKTIVKEWLGQLLSPHFFVVKSPKSYNSQVGVPLAVWELNSAHDLAIFEAGISKPGEMENLEKVIAPTIGVFTNLGPAHDEGFTNRQQKAAEKARLFKNCPEVIYCRDYPEVHHILQQQTELDPEKKLIVWSKWDAEDGFVNLLSAEKDPVKFHTTLQLNCRQTPDISRKISFTIPFTDDASIENCMHCIVYMLYQGFDEDVIQSGIEKLRKVSMRMELKQGINQCYLLDDSYSNDLAGLQIALDFLIQQKKSDQYTVILSDMLQTGVSVPTLYTEVARLLAQKNITRLIGIGKAITQHQGVFQNTRTFTSQFYKTTEAYLKLFKPDDYSNEVILVKGARQFGFEHIVKQLQQKTHGTTLEINLDALTHNLNYYRNKLEESTKIMVMVKAFSYGGASFEIANLLQFHRVDYLGVAYADEGIMLRENGIQLPILILNPTPESFDKAAKFRLEPEIYSTRLLREYIKIAEDSSNLAALPPIHLKIDTGMHRLGFSPDEIPELIQLLKQNPCLQVGSVFSHLAASDEATHQAFTLQQVVIFDQCYTSIAAALGYRPMRHILNSAGMIHFPQYQFEMVRLGIGLYGVEVSQQEQNALESVGTLRTVISQIKSVKAGDTVGYGRRGKISKNTTIATIAIGYADGFDRRFGNGVAQVIIRGKLAPTIGNICMDMCMVDITQIPEAQEGDEVIVFGREQAVTMLANAIGTIPYELLTGIGERVKRVYFTE